jgi:hypothetical protein
MRFYEGLLGFHYHVGQSFDTAYLKSMSGITGKADSGQVLW